MPCCLERENPGTRMGYKPTAQDIEWLKVLENYQSLGRAGTLIPSRIKRRLIVLGLIVEKPGRLEINDMGRKALGSAK
jgi:hypothetical protein